jgi:spore maturation protein CgeB
MLVLERVQQELESRGIEISVTTHLYGENRTRFLNRTKVSLNILRAPQDWVGQRFLLGAANKTLIISEPINDSEPFVAGHHIVIAPIEKLAETIAFYLSHSKERLKIVEEAHRFVTQELTITQMIGRILDRAREIYASRR